MTRLEQIGWVVAIISLSLQAAIFFRSSKSFSSSENARYVLVAEFFFVVAVFARAPALFLFERVWAETGTLYFSYSYEHGPIASLFRQISNYFDLGANIASATAVTVGVRYWPAVDTIFGLLTVAFIPIFLRLLAFRPVERIGILFVLSISIYLINSGEIFGTMLQMKVWGAVYTFLVLLSFVTDKSPSKFRIFCLAVLPLSGPAATMLIMIFGVTAFVLGARKESAQILWSVPALLVQIVSGIQPGEATGHAVRPLSLWSIFFASDLLVVKGFGSIFNPQLVLARENVPWVRATIVNVCVFAFLLAIAFRSLRKPNDRGFLALIPVQVFHFAATVLFAIGGAVFLYDGAGFRYYFAALSMAFCQLVVWDKMASKTARGAIIGVGLIAVLIARNADRDLNALFFHPDQRSWNAQVEMWEKDSSTPLLIYPRWGAQLKLPNCGAYHC